MNLSVMIIGPPGRLRDGLRAVLEAVVEITWLRFAADCQTAAAYLIEKRPELVIVDGEISGLNDFDKVCSILKSTRNSHSLFIANSLSQRSMAYAKGADAVLLHGFSVCNLRDTLYALFRVQPTPIL